MKTPDMVLKNKSREFMDRVIYPRQFKNDHYKTIYHIINVCSPLLDKKYVLQLVNKYVHGYDSDLLDLALENYISNNKTLFRYQCFTHIEEVLKEQDLFFFKSGKKRYVKLSEYKFMLHRITSHLYKSKGCRSVMINRMFLKMRPEYFKSTGRNLDGHKLSYIFQVLQKHKYVHVTYNLKNQRVVQIGPNNPYYQLRKVPDIDKSELKNVQTKTERELEALKSKVEIYQRVRKEDLATISSLQQEMDMALYELEKLKSVNQSLTEMHQEDLAEIEKLRTIIHEDGICSNR